MNVVTPSLRFIGFQGRWHEANLEGISIKNISYGIVQTGEYIDDGVPCIRVVDLTKAKINKKTLIKASDEISNSYRKTILEEGELMIALRGEIGLTQLVFEELVGCNLTRGVARVSPNKNLYDTRFLCAFLNSAKVRQEFDRRKNGSALKEIPISELKKFPVLFPELKEQQKIADFLTSVDTKISQLTEKHRLLKDYKKGVMQQIFSQQIRFKDDDGNAFPNWNEYSLRDILILQSDALKMDDEATYELITVKRGFGGVKSRGHFKGKDVLVKSQFTIHKGEFVISKRQIVHGACGLVPEELNGAIVSNEYNVFRPQPTKLDIDYFNRLSTTLYMRRAFFINSDGVHIEKLLFKTQSWLKTKVHLPALKEQQKIAQFLQSLDKKIDAVSEQIEQIKLFKKGLLQQMFV